MSIVRIITAQGPLQLLNVLTVLRSAELNQATQEYEDILILDGFGVSGNPIASQNMIDICKNIGKIWNFKKIFPLTEIQSLFHSKKCTFLETVQILKNQLNLNHVEEIYTCRNWQFFNELILTSYPVARKICYGDGLGWLNLKEGSDEAVNPSGLLSMDEAHLINPVDLGDSFSICPIKSVDPEIFISVVKESANQIQGLQDYCQEIQKNLGGKSPTLFLTSMETETKLVYTSGVNVHELLKQEIEGYLSVILECSDPNSTRILVKGHPRQRFNQSSLVSKLLNEKRYSVFNASQFNLVPIELFTPFIQFEKAVTLSCSASVSVAYLCQSEIILGYGSSLLEKYFRDQAQIRVIGESFLSVLVKQAYQKNFEPIRLKDYEQTLGEIHLKPIHLKPPIPKNLMNHSTQSETQNMTDNHQSSSNLVKLHLGCGTNLKPGYINIDQYVSAPNITKMDIFHLQFDTNSVDEIFSEHMLEHLSKYEVPQALKEWSRVLKPEGKLVMNLPNLEWCIQQWLEKPETNRWGWQLDTIFGLETHPGEFHKTGFTIPRLRQLLTEAGFRKISISDYWSHEQGCFWVEASKSEQANIAPETSSHLESPTLTKKLIQLPGCPKISSVSDDMTRPLISVMIPTYNPKKHYLEQVLNSVLEQDLGSIETEIVVVDDASTEVDVAVIVKEVGQGRISFYQQPQNLGLIDNWNYCLEKAKGHWIHILHQDDLIKPGFYQGLQKSIKNYPEIGAIFCRHFYIDEAGNQRFTSPLEQNNTGILPNWIERIATEQRIQFASILVKREVYENLGGFYDQAGSAADWEMWQRIAAYYPVCYEPQILACFRLHSNSETSRLMKIGGNIADTYKAVEIARAYLPRDKAPELAQKAREHYAIEAMKLAGSMLAQKNISAATSLIREGLQCSDSAKVVSSLVSLFLSTSFEYQPQIEKTRKLPKVIVDGVFFQIHNTGIARVWKSLLEEWAGTDFAKQILVLDRVGTCPKIPGIQYLRVPAYDYNKTTDDRRMLQLICDAEKADLFISTYYTTPLSTPSIFMAYDMIPEVMGANLNSPMWREKQYGIKHATAYITISENTARDLLKCFPDIPSDTVTVAPCGIQPVFSPATSENITEFKSKYNILKPYFLLVGERCGFNGYKNALLFFQAFSQLGQEQELEIVCVGGQPELESQLKIYVNNSRVHLLRLTDEELRVAYSGAIALVHVSKYEGFGLPILEAMACGCPVITCGNGSIPEVAGQAALYVNPDDVQELIKALLDVQKLETRQSLVTTGFNQAKKFSWSNMAEKVSEALIKANSAPKTPSPTSVNPPTSVTDAITQYQKNPADANALNKLRQDRYQMANFWLNLSPQQLASSYPGTPSQIQQSLLNSGLKYEPLTDTEKGFIHQLSQKIAQGWTDPKSVNYLLAAMLYYRADQLPIQFKQAAIPSWFLNEYFKFMFTPPSFFQTLGEANNYHRYLQEWLSYLHQGILTNSQTPIWQQLAKLFTQIGNFITLYFTTTPNLKDIYVKRAEIMEVALKSQGCQLDYTFPPRSINRSKIRLGILKDHFNPQTETFALLPVFEHLDRNQFEIFLYAINSGNHPLEQYCQKCADKLVKLPANLNEQAQTIRGDDLDILFIGSNVTAVSKALTWLAVHRLARIQLTSINSPTTTGMRSVDYYLGGQFAAPPDLVQDHYREELVTFPGSGLCFRYPLPEAAASVKLSRQNIGATEETVIFISGANFYKILPELRQAWAKIIARVPNSILVLYPFNPNWTSAYPAVAFTNEMRRAFTEAGVAPNRLTVIKSLPTRADIKELLKLGDIYLDSYPYGGATSLIDPLEVGLIPLVMQGQALRFRQASALLEDLQIPDLITTTEDAYINLAIQLGTNPQLRHQYRHQIQEKMANNPPFLDSRAYSAQMGALFQQLFQKWQTENQPAVISTQPPMTPGTPALTAPEFLNRLIGCVNLYQIDPTETSVVQELRHLRQQLANYWLTVPTPQLPSLYQGQLRNTYMALLTSGCQKEPLTDSEQPFVQQLTQISKGLQHPQAINALLGLMLYFPPAKMRVQDAQTRLPAWLLPDYQQVFETQELPTLLPNQAPATVAPPESQAITSQAFINRLIGCVNLYEIDPTAQNIVTELRQLRQQLAQYWLTIPTAELPTIYQGELGNAYRGFLRSGFQKEPLSPSEQNVFQQLTQVSQGLQHPQAIQAFLGAMLYFVPGKMRVQNADTRLPSWLVPDYQQVFEQPGLFADQQSVSPPGGMATTQPPAPQQPTTQPSAINVSTTTQQFLNQLQGCVNLYRIDPTDQDTINELRQIRKQMADFWLAIAKEQLEIVYFSEVGQGYKTLLMSGLQTEPLLEVEQAFFQQITTALSQGINTSQGINYLLVAMLYCRPGQLQVQNAQTILPRWFLPDYERFTNLLKVPVH